MNEFTEEKLYFPANLSIEDLYDSDPFINAPKPKNKSKGTLKTINEVELALFRCNKEVFAVKAKCPHLGGPLHLGDIEALPDKTMCIRCPWHKWKFDLHSGKIKFPEGKNLVASVFPTKVDDKNNIFIGFDALDPSYFNSDKF